MRRMIRITLAAVVLGGCLAAGSISTAAAQDVVVTTPVQTVAYRPWVRPYAYGYGYGYRPYAYRAYRPYYRPYAYRPYYGPYYGYRAYRPFYW
jgi:hypothetical protein